METLAQSDLLPLPPLPPKHLFTATDVAAAELLVQISSSSASAASSSASCSPRSVNTRPPVEVFSMEAEEEALGLWRRTKRYRVIADLYASTEPIDVSVGEKRSRR